MERASFLMAEKKKNKKEKGVLETIREVNQKERSERLHRESELVKKAAQKKEKQNEEYDKQLRQEKIELIKQRQGMSDGAELVGEQQAVRYTFGQRVGAFFYCNKAIIIVAAFFIFLAAFLIRDLISKDRPDVTLMILNNDFAFEQSYRNLASIIDEYITDVNENGETHSTMYYMPLSKELDPYTLQASSTKLFAIMQDGETMLVIGNSEVEEYLLPEQTLENLEELYPENEHIDGYGFYLADTKFAEEIGYEGKLPEDVYIGIRKVSKGARYREKMQKNYDHAKNALDKLIERYS